jgi:hypothetical protein
MDARLTRRRRNVGHLVLAWAAYWLALILVTLWPAIAIAWRISRPGQHGSASAGFDGNVLHLTLQNDGATAFNATTTVATAALWIALPALLIWAIWLFVAAPARDVTEPAPRRIDALPAPDTLPMPAARDRERDRARRDDRA